MLVTNDQPGTYGGIYEHWKPQKPDVTLLQQLLELQGRRESHEAENVGDSEQPLCCA